MKKIIKFLFISQFIIFSPLLFSQSKDEKITERSYISSEVTVIGSKSNSLRTVTSSAVPIDIINSDEIAQSGATELTQLINYIIPSFSSERQTFADGNDHSEPATLRNLGPDQVLVLINGKRRHRTSLVTVTPVVGKGSVGVDFNTIPINSIDRIEVLRDGAATQYGSDAIAGVINIILKNSTNNLTMNAISGITSQGDGFFYNAGFNYGFNLPKNGFFNISIDAKKREPTNRNGDYNGLVFRSPDQDSLSFEENFQLDNQILEMKGLKRSDFNLKIGNSDMMNIGTMFNSELPINDNFKLYGFGGLNYRDSKAPGYYRLPNDIRNNTAIYPNGFLPYLRSKISDYSFAIGTKYNSDTWFIDISNSFGTNNFHFFVENSLNRAYGDSTPTNFDAGLLGFIQNSLNIDFSKNMESIIGISKSYLNFGAEFRYESYKQTKGELASYYAPNPNFEPGSQVFPGFAPQNEINKSAISIAGYLDLEGNITENWFINLGTRYENYDSDNSAIVGKIASIYKFYEEFFNLRFSIGSGYRMPSLQQRFYNKNNTQFVNFGTGFFPVEIATLTNDNEVVKALGFPELKAEQSMNYSLGFTSQLSNNTSLTLDAYFIEINDRIVLSGLFTKFDPYIAELIKNIPGADAFQFFTNAINTRTKGIDIVLNQKFDLSNYGNLNITIAANISETSLFGNIKTSNTLPDSVYASSIFSREEIARLENGQPNNKILTSLNYNYEKLNVDLSFIRYGEVIHKLEDPNLDQIFSGKWISNLLIKYRFIDNFTLKFNIQNLFDVYPDENKEIMRDYGRFPYNTAVTQFGLNGRTIIAGIELNI